MGVERSIARWVTGKYNPNTLRESKQHTATLTPSHSSYKTIPRAYKGPMALQKNKVTLPAPRGQSDALGKRGKRRGKGVEGMMKESNNGL